MSREDVLACDWNTRLLACISECFVEAVSFFALQDAFVYEWLKFLPSYQPGNFWSGLLSRILASLNQVPVLLLRGEDASSQQFALPKAVKLLPYPFLHDNAPLLQDTERPTVYLADGYRTSGLENKLLSLGVEPFTCPDVLDRIQHDLYTSSHSLIKNTDLDSDWHSQFGRLLEEMIKHEDFADIIKPRLWALPVIPLQSGSWGRPSDAIFNCTVLKQAVPKDLGFNLLHEAVSKTGEQKQLYSAMGITDCNPKEVCLRIIRSHKTVSFGGDVSLLVSHLEFLHRHASDLSPDAVQNLFIVTSGCKPARVSKGLYFQSSLRYSTQQLFTSIRSDLITRENFDTEIFLHDLYVHPHQSTKARNGLTWVQWLEQKVHVRYYPPLTDLWGKLSPLLSLVLESDSVEFLGALRSHWVESYDAASDPKKFPSTNKALQQAQVTCVNGPLKPMEATYFPTEELLTVCRSLHLEQIMSFIKLPENPGGEDDWALLHRFKVGFKPNLKFYLDCALNIRNISTTAKQLEAAVKIYENIGQLASLGNEKTISVWLSESLYHYNC